MLAQVADADRLRGLPIHIIHGALDWMFPVELARQAHRVLARAGATVTFREVEDLSHTYPREMNVSASGIGRQLYPERHGSWAVLAVTDCPQRRVPRNQLPRGRGTGAVGL